MAESYSVRAILSAEDKSFSSTMKSCAGYANNLKTTLTGGLGFGAMAAIGGKAVSAVGTGIKAMAKETVGAGMSFQSAMSSVSAVSGATGKDLTDLTNKAKEVCASSKFSATEVAKAMGYMGMAGWKTGEMLAGTTGIINLAAASNTDLARTSDIVTDALTAFGKSAGDSGEFADVMAAASANANTNVEMMGETFKYVGSVAGAMKYSIQDVALATGLMANSSIKGGEAGTALRSIMTRMAKPTKESATAMEALGMSLTDGNRKMKSFKTVITDLRKGMQGMTEDQKASYAAMLGGQEAMAGVLAIANASEKDFNKLSAAIENSKDAAEKMAEIKMDNLEGKVTTLKSRFEGLGITIFGQVGNALVNLTDVGISAIDSINQKLEDGKGIQTFVDKISSGVKKAKPYWDVFKEDAVEVGNAFGEAVSAISGELEKMNGSFGSSKSIKGFSETLGDATDALTTFAGFLKEHDEEVAKAIKLLPKLYVAYRGFKIVTAITPGVKTFTKAVLGLTGKGIAAIAGKLFGVAAGEKAVGLASKESSGNIVESATAFLAIGAGVALIAAGFTLLAYSAVRIANAGPLAAGVLIGMTVAVAGLMVVAKNVAPAMTAGAAGFVAFGAAVLLAGAGITVLSLAAINLANTGPLAIACMAGMVAAIAGLALGASALGPALTVGAAGFIAFGAAIVLVATGALIASAALAVVAGILPTIVQYGIQGAGCITALGVGMIMFGAGAAVAGVGCVALGAGLAVVGAGLLVVGAAVLVAASGVLLLATGALLLGTGLTVAGVGLNLIGAAFPAVSAGAVGALGALTALLGVSVGLVAGMGASAVVVVAFGAAMAGGAAGTLAMVVALKSVNSSMKSIAGNAKSAQSSLTSMRASVNVVNSGLDALGSRAKSAVNTLVKQFSNAEGKARSSGNAVGNNFNNGVRSGMNRAVSTARSMSASTVSAMRSAGSGSYSCGVYIGAGLANGMASQVGRVRSVAAQLAAAAEAAIRAKAQIHSPSRVSDKLGSYFGIGWVNAILGKVKLARKAAAQLVQIPELETIPDIGMNIRTGIEDLNDDYEYTRNETYTIYVPVEVDGRQVAKATAKYTKEEIEQQQKRDLRKKGMR